MSNIKKNDGALFEEDFPLLLMAIIATFVVLTLPQFPNAIGHWLFPGSSRTVEVRNLVIGGLQDRQELTTVSMSTKATVHASKYFRISR